MAHTEECRRLGDQIDAVEAEIADLTPYDAPDLPEVGEEIDQLDRARDDLWAEWRALHSSGGCPGRGEVVVGTTTGGTPIVTDGTSDADPPAVHVAVTLPDGTPAGGWTTDATGQHTPDPPAGILRKTLGDPDLFRAYWNGP